MMPIATSYDAGRNSTIRSAIRWFVGLSNRWAHRCPIEHGIAPDDTEALPDSLATGVARSDVDTAGALLARSWALGCSADVGELTKNSLEFCAVADRLDRPMLQTLAGAMLAGDRVWAAE